MYLLLSVASDCRVVSRWFFHPLPLSPGSQLPLHPYTPPQPYREPAAHSWSDALLPTLGLYSNPAGGEREITIEQDFMIAHWDMEWRYYSKIIMLHPPTSQIFEKLGIGSGTHINHQKPSKKNNFFWRVQWAPLQDSPSLDKTLTHWLSSLQKMWPWILMWITSIAIEY